MSIQRFTGHPLMPSSGYELVTRRGIVRVGMFHYRVPTLWHFAAGERWTNAPEGSWQLRVWVYAIAWFAAPNT
jgi:hypothetical protein